MRKLILLAFAVLFIGCPGEDPIIEPKDVVDLLPLDGEISGWNRTAAMRVAENATQLWDLINGEGQVFIDNGFVKCAFQDYQGELTDADVDLELRIFDMGDTTNARAVFDAVATGAETPWTDNPPGDEARIDESLLFAYKVDYIDERFYVWVTIQEKSDPALDVAKLFALNVSAAIRDSS
jgi:hypothetical protein